MAWIWVGMGGALVLGVCLRVMLMSLLVLSRDSQSDEGLSPHRPEGKTMPNRGSAARAVAFQRRLV